MSPVAFVSPGFLLKSPISLLSRKPGALDDDVRAVAAFERVGVRDRQAVAIDHREVRRLVRFRRGRRHDVLAELDAARGLLALDRASDRPGVCLRRQPRDRARATKSGSPRCRARSRYARRIASICRCSAGAVSRPFDLRSSGSSDVQHLDERDAARARRRHRDDVVALVGASHRRALFAPGRRRDPLS